MHLKGIEKLREKLPDYPGNRIRLIPFRGLIATLLGYVFLIILDVSPRIFNDIALLVIVEPYLPFIGSVFVGGIGLIFVKRIWDLREERRAKYGDLAYQNVMTYGVLGVFLIPALIFHAFTSVRSLPPTSPVNELTILWSQSILPMIGFSYEIDIILRMGLSSIFILIGILLLRSSILTFGIDYMTIVYLYFPEESQVQDNEIYSVVRHPAYLAIVLLGIAALFLRFSVYSIGYFIIIYFIFRLQIRREEKELVERFGDGYTDYMRNVPALYVSPRRLRKLLRFLRTK